MYILSEFIFEPFNSRAKRGDFSPTNALRFYALFVYLNFPTEGKPRTDVRARLRRSVIRMRKDETAIRIRTVIRTPDNTAP